MGCERRAASVDFRVPPLFQLQDRLIQTSAESMLTQVNHGSTTPYKTAQSTIHSPLPEMRKGCPSTSPLQNVQ